MMGTPRYLNISFENARLVDHQKNVLTELGLECRRSLGDSFPEDELLALMQALFSEWTLFT